MQNGDQPVTKAELKETLAALDARFEGRMDAMEQRLRDHTVATVRDSETRLLQAFYGYAESTRKHLGQHDLDLALVLSRVSTLENRVVEVEKRLNIPPTA